jgi:hypothetical protein
MWAHGFGNIKFSSISSMWFCLLQEPFIFFCLLSFKNVQKICNMIKHVAHMEYLNPSHDSWCDSLLENIFCRLRKQRNCERERKQKLNDCLTWRIDKSKDCKKSVNHRERSLIAPVYNLMLAQFFVIFHTFLALYDHYLFFLPVEWRSYTAKGAVPGCCKKGTWSSGKEISGYDFNIACTRHTCWRWWGMLCLVDTLSPLPCWL